jgi:beta-1,4-mannosyl-glycoprotein beta-1,4-N-acetylglucosaminyltransferase
VIVDVFLFNDEFFHLECRLHELEGVVDRFIAIEGNLTMQGQQKPFLLKEKHDKYRHFGLDVVSADLRSLDDVPAQKYSWVESQFEDNWKRDWKQRDAVTKIIQEFPEDTIYLMGDVDEIPKRETVAAFHGNARALHQALLTYSVKYVWNEPWLGTVIGTRAELKTFARARNERWKYPVLPDGGWHLSWFGGELAIQKKAREFAHGEMARDAKLVAEKLPREHIRPAGGLLDPYDGPLPRWVEAGHAPNSWYLEW